MRHPYVSRNDKTAVEIGHIIMNWATVDSGLDDLLVELACLDDEQTAQVFCGNLEFRSKIQTIKGLAFLHHAQHPHIADDWLSTTHKLLDYLDNELRPQRNLIAHAHWYAPYDRKSPALVTKKTKLLKPQAFQLNLETMQTKSFTHAQLRGLSERILDFWFDLMHVCWYGQRPFPPRLDENGLELPQLSFQLYLREVGHRIRAVDAFPRAKRTPGRHQKAPRPANKPSP